MSRAKPGLCTPVSKPDQARRHLANIARVLGQDPETDISFICKAQWLEWQVFHEDGPKEPPPVENNPGRFVDPETY
jgi:hypothetical protein